MQSRAMGHEPQRRLGRLAATTGLVLTGMAVLTGAPPGAAALCSAVWVADSTVCIDGRLDEPLWCSGAATDAFVDFHPVPGAPPTQGTELYLAYDAERLYFAFRCHDTQPQLIRARLAKRDTAFEDDWVGVILKGSAAERGAAELIVNARGCQLDAYVPGSSGGDDFSVDYPFTSAAVCDSFGWSAEMAIPFSSLQHVCAATPALSFFAVRHLSRSGERSAYPVIAIADQDWISHGAPLVLAAAERRAPLEILPTAVATRHAARTSQASWASDTPTLRLGLSARCGLSSALTLDASINPDFSQVEADAAQVEVNQRFPILRIEKRPFFQEGREIFDLAAQGGAIAAAFHSRTIIAPRWGVKVTGGLGQRDRCGILVARDRWSGPAGDPAAATSALAGVVRYRRGLDPGSFFGFFATGRGTVQGHNCAAGVDADLLLARSARFALHALCSHTRRTDRVPRSPAHAAAARFSLLGRNRGLDVSYEEVGPAFRLENGFVARWNLRTAAVRYRHTLYPHLPGLLRLVGALRLEGARDFAGRPLDQAIVASVRAEGPAQNALTLGHSWAEEYFSASRFDAGVWTLAAETGALAWVRCSASCRWAGTPIYDSPCGGQGREQTLVGDLVLQPSARITLALSATQSALTRQPTGETIFRVLLLRGRLLFQAQRQTHLRAIVQWDGGAREVMTDLLASFGSGVGTAVHVGFGNLYQETTQPTETPASPALREACRELFLKVAYSWRL